jgi:hypothetical protein
MGGRGPGLRRHRELAQHYRDLADQHERILRWTINRPRSVALNAPRDLPQAVIKRLLLT